MDTGKFAEWLNIELYTRKMNQSELAQTSGLSASYISQILARKREPGKDALKAIAKGLGMTAESIYKLVGLIEVTSDDIRHGEVAMEVATMFQKLPVGDQEFIYLMIKYMYDRDVK